MLKDQYQKILLVTADDLKVNFLINVTNICIISMYRFHNMPVDKFLEKIKCTYYLQMKITLLLQAILISPFWNKIHKCKSIISSFGFDFCDNEPKCVWVTYTSRGGGIPFMGA